MYPAAAPSSIVRFAGFILLAAIPASSLAQAPMRIEIDSPLDVSSDSWYAISVGSAQQPVSDLYGVSFVLTYDPDVFEVDGTSPGLLLGGSLLYFFYTDTPGRVAATITRKGDFPGVSGAGQIAGIRLRVRQGTPHNTKTVLNLTDVAAFDSDRNEVPLAPSPASVTLIKFDAQLRIDADLSATSAGRGDDVSLGVVVENYSPGETPDVEVTLDLPAGLSVVSSSDGAFDLASLRWDVGLLGADETRRLDLILRVGPEAEGTLPLTAAVAAPWPEYNLDDNVAEASLDVVTVRYQLAVDAYPTVGPISVDVSPVDVDAQGPGTTPFSRTYDEGTTVDLLAPAESGARVFRHWVVGQDVVPGAQLELVLSGPTSVVAVYVRSGDLTGDDRVRLDDLGPAIAVWASGAYDPAADLDRDGAVTLLDVVFTYALGVACAAQPGCGLPDLYFGKHAAAAGFEWRPIRFDAETGQVVLPLALVSGSTDGFGLTLAPADPGGTLDVRPVLPAGWHATHRVVDGRLVFLAAGSGPLEPGIVAEVVLAPGTARVDGGAIETLEGARQDLGPVDTAPPASFGLAPNYPNPFNPRTTIRFDLAQATDVRLEVYDGRGRRVAVLAEGPHPAGAYEVDFDAGALASGLYLCRLRAGGRTHVIEMTLLK